MTRNRITILAPLFLGVTACVPSSSKAPSLLSGTPDAGALRSCDIMEGTAVTDHAPTVQPILRNVSCKPPGSTDTVLSCAFEARAQGFDGVVIAGAAWISGEGNFRHPNTGHSKDDATRWCATSWSANLSDEKVTKFEIY